VDLGWEDAVDNASPPVEFNVYRDTVSGFTPSAASLVARTPFSSYRARGLAPETEYFFVVRAVDASNNEDGNTVELSAITGVGDPLPPDQGNVVRAVKSGADLELHFPDAQAGLWRVYRDPTAITVGTTALSPDLSTPDFVDTEALADTLDYYYALRGLSPCSHTPGP
jgi:hypothetical protein